MAYVHIHNHSEYSLLDGHTKVKAMAKRAKELEMPAIALTDHGYMYGIPAFVSACQNKDYGVKPLIGCEVYFTPDSTLARDRKPELYHMVLIAKNHIGYRNLLSIVSKAATDGFYYKPRVTFESLAANSSGLIATSACLAGIIPRRLFERKEDDAREWALKFASLLEPGDFYIELQNQGLMVNAKNKDSQDQGDGEGGNNVSQSLNSMTQTELNHLLNNLAKSLGFKTVAANDLHYLNREDARAQDLMLCIGTGSKVADENRMRFDNDEFYLKTEEEMRGALADFQDACDNTVEIADKCENNLLDEKVVVRVLKDRGEKLTHDKILPLMPIVIADDGGSKAAYIKKKFILTRSDTQRQQEDVSDEDVYLYERAFAGLKQKYADPLPNEVLQRFEYEYNIILDQGFPAYFLVVSEFVSWAKNNGVGVGPGRGSAAGSIISYALGITTLDPLANGLLFERFMSLERVEMPDIDIDFDEDGRFEVIEHLRELYGSDKVAHVITYGSMKAKQAINDSARVLDRPIYEGQNISNMISRDPKALLDAHLSKNPDAAKNKAQTNPDLVKLYNQDEQSKSIIDAALSLEGTVRGEGVHASAVIISPVNVSELVPVKLDTKGGVIITQYDGKHNADLGLLKMDFLGLRTLNVLMKAKEYVLRSHGVEIDLDTIPLNDKKVFEMLQRGETAGVFQVESSGMTALMRSMMVDSYDDIVAAIALFRPGPLDSGMLDDYVSRKTGKTKVVYYDDRLATILAETYGTLVYQEQVMRISMQMSNFTAGESDVVRKAVAKKNIKLMKEDVREWADGNIETMEAHWINGAKRNGYDPAVAQKIWADVEKFAEYAFNKSHSAAYAVLVMQTGWMKAYYPVEFMAAVLSSFVGKADRLTQYIAACKQSGIDVLPPDVNSSDREFTAVGQAIRFGLAGIRGVGEMAADLIISEREHGGRFTSVHDFVFRVLNTACNKRAVESLIKSGAFDSTGYTRKQMMQFLEVDNLMDKAAKHHQDKTDGQMSLMDLFDDDEDAGADLSVDIPQPTGVEWDRRTKLGFEKEILKMYVSDHPLSPYLGALQKASEFPLSVFMQTDDEEANTEDFPDGSAATTVPTNRAITVAGMVTDIKQMMTKKGDRMAKFTIEDMEGSIDIILFPKIYDNVFSVTGADGCCVAEDEVVVVRGRYEPNDRGQQIIGSSVERLALNEETGKVDETKTLEMCLPSDKFNQSFSDVLVRILKEYPGNDPLVLHIVQSDGKRYRVNVPMGIDGRSTTMIYELKALLNENNVDETAVKVIA